jgi:hypothetical protein
LTKIFRHGKLFRLEIAFGLGFLVPALPGWGIPEKYPAVSTLAKVILSLSKDDDLEPV